MSCQQISNEVRNANNVCTYYCSCLTFFIHLAAADTEIFTLFTDMFIFVCDFKFW